VPLISAALDRSGVPDVPLRLVIGQMIRPDAQHPPTVPPAQIAQIAQEERIRSAPGMPAA